MKQHKNTTKDPLRDRPGNKKERINKPWIFSYKVIDVAYLKLWHKEKIDEWYDQEYLWKYSSVEHALQQLNKEMRSYWFVSKNKHAGKEIRLLNKDTGEVVPLEVKNNEVIVKQEL